MATRRIKIPLIGPTSKASSGAQSSGVTMNLYPEVNDDPNARAVIALTAVPGSFRWADATAAIHPQTPIPTDAEVRGAHVMGSRAFVAIHNQILEVRYELNGFFPITTTPTFDGPVGFSDNGDHLIIGDGTGFRAFNLLTGVSTPILNDGEEPILGTWSCFDAGTTVYVQRDTGTYHFSEVGDPTTVRGLSYFSAESNPDKIVRPYVLNGELILLGEHSTEWHKQVGGDSVYERIAFVEHGSVAPRASCLFDNTVVSIDQTHAGGGRVVRLRGAGAAPEIISNAAVEKAIEKVLFFRGENPRITDHISMFSYDDQGHAFFLLNLPEVRATVNNPAQRSMTPAYDAATNMWHERGYREPATGQFERILGDCHFYWNGRHYLGAYNAPHLYELSRDYYRENTEALVKLRQSSGPVNLGVRFTGRKLGIEMEVGVGRDRGVQGSDPLLMARVSWDGGNTWSNQMTRSIGKIGEYKTTVEFGPFGSGHNLVIEAAVSDPVRVTFLGAWADVELASR